MSKLKIYNRLLKEGSAFAVQALVVNKLRTLLSLLGVTIGIFLIISVFTLVDSLESSLRGAFSSLGDDALFIERMPWGPEPGDEAYAWWKYMQRPNVNYEELKTLKGRMTTAKSVSLLAGARRLAENGNSSASITVVSVSEGYDDFIAVEIEKGRGFSTQDLKSNNRYCLIGHDVANQLFGSVEPVGRQIKVAGFKATIIGVMEKEGTSIFGDSNDERILIPTQFGRLIMNMRNSNVQIALKPKDGIEKEVMESEALMHMRNIRRLRPNEDKNFAMNKSSMLNKGLDEVFGILTVVGALIGGFSILVGGFSIANIMFVSVRERTSIIGIQKALGAKRSFILFQFLFESVFLCFIGGSIGLLVIWLGTFLASMATGFDLTLTVENVLIGVGFSVSIGLIAGIIPASIAARMEPVEAIRSTG